MDIISVLMYSIRTIFLMLALLFVYYSVRCAHLMKGAIGRYSVAVGAVLITSAGMIQLAGLFSPYRIYIYPSMLFIQAVGIPFIIFGFVYTGKAVQKTYPASLFKIALIYPGSKYNLMGVVTIVFCGVPTFIWDIIEPGISWESVINIGIWTFAFANLALAARIHYLTAKSSAAAAAAAAAAGGKETMLLRDDVLAVRSYGALTNTFLATAKPAIGDKPLRDTLTEHFKYNPLLFEGCGIKEDGTIDIESVMKNLDRIHGEHRVKLLCSMFSTLNSKIMNLYGAVTSPELAEKRLEEGYLSVKKQYGDMPIFFDILRTLPEGVLEEERLGLLSKKELESRVKERTLELEKALEDVKRERGRVEKLAKSEKERTRKLEDSRSAMIYMLDDLDKAYKELEKSAEVETKAAAAAGARRAMENVMNTMVDTLIVVDPDGNIRMANKALSDILGYDEKEIIGTPVDKIFAPPKGGAAAAAAADTMFRGVGLERLISEGFVKDVEMTYLTKNGKTIPMSFSGSVMKDESGELAGIVCVAKDLSDIKKLVNDLDKAYTDLKVLDTAKSDFIAIASHELKTPLSIIHGYCTLLQDGTLGKLDKVQKEKIGNVVEETEKLIKMVSDILDLSAIEAGKLPTKKDVMAIPSIVESVVKEIEPLATEKKQRIIVEIPEKPVVVGDKDRISTVFHNLLDNAIKYTPNNGTITVKAQDNGKNLHLMVSDTGKGIPSKDLEKIFDRFYIAESHLTRKGGGMGLGLSICKGIIEAHKGKIWAESTMVKGSTFHFTLPKKEKMEG